MTKANHKSTIFFAHANGFPSTTYRKFFSYLESDFTIQAIENVGHDLQYPWQSNWEHLALELEHYLEKNFSSPVIGVGHSLGGGLHYITALKRPELYQQLVILDSPMYGEFKSIVLKFLKLFHLMGKITPSVSSSRRRNFWVSRDAAFDYFKNKPLYKNFDPDCLRDYVNFGMQDVSGGVRLIAEPEIEGEIFENLPDNLAWKKAKLPVTFVHAEQSHVISKRDLQYLKRKFTVVSIPGSHLFPFEMPEKGAQCVRQIIQDRCAGE